VSRPKSYGDALFADCPTRTVFDTISGRWVPLILVALAKEPSGYRELLRSIEGRVRNSQYELTPLGETLLPIVQAVKVWAEEHLPEVEAARQARIGEGT
jgi:DNA-binding HxlR family transcriptional regulator